MRTLALIYLLTAFSLFGQPANLFPGAAYVATKTVAPISTPWITSYTPGSLRNNYEGTVGCKILTGTGTLTVQSLGRWIVSGNNQSHTIYLLASDGATVLRSASVNASGQTPGQFAYVSCSPYQLSASTTYYVVSTETSGGDYFYDLNTPSVTGVASSVYSCYGATPPAGETDNEAGGGNEIYVPVNFTYTIP